jgi:hypothetical protein
MKTMLCAILFSVIVGMAFSPVSSYAFGGGEPPWSAPMMPGGKLVKAEGTAAYYEFDQPYEAVLAWYREALKNYRDPNYAHVDWAKYRDWKDQMYIEDQGAAPWHSIGIQKGGGNKTLVKIVRDNFTWIFSTLLIRFAGVFCVLIILWLLLNLNGIVMKKYFSEKEVKAKAG